MTTALEKKKGVLFSTPTASAHGNVFPKSFQSSLRENTTNQREAPPANQESELWPFQIPDLFICSDCNIIPASKFSSKSKTRGPLSPALSSPVGPQL